MIFVPNKYVLFTFSKYLINTIHSNRYLLNFSLFFSHTVQSNFTLKAYILFFQVD